MPYNSGVATSMYNTRRSAYLNSCSTSEATTTQMNHMPSWSQDDDYIPTSCNSNNSPMQYSSSKGRSSSPADQSYEVTEKKASRKRANTTSSGNGENKRTANKICRVCGDKAFSYNFNVITCESCKAFFRRNANKEKEIRCPFNSQCEINVVSRRFCQRCRLAKCFNVGMKKEWIMTDEARLEKKQRVEENRERRLQDAIRAAEEEYIESEEQSLDEPPTSQTDQMCVVDYIINQNDDPNTILDPVHLQQNQSYPMKDDPKQNDMYHNSDFSNHDYDFAGIAPLSSTPHLFNQHQMVDSIPTTGASSTADVSATTTSMPSMDVDPSTTMTSNGFMPPSLGHANPANLVPPVEVEHTLLNVHAQAQLVAQVQHVQAAINQQQQQLAAVVAAQRAAAAQMNQPPPNIPHSASLAPVMPPSNVQNIPQSMPNSMNMNMNMNMNINTNTNMNTNMNMNINPMTSIEEPMMPQQNNPVVMNQMGPSSSDLITVPRDVLMKVIQNNTVRSMSCCCTCECGRYPPGSNIVEEVTKDLLNVGSSNSSSGDEAKLETAEDMQRNGLLPSDDSSVQWLNSASLTIDPSNYLDEPPMSRRDSLYMPLLDSALAEAIPPEFSSEEKEQLDQINEVANQWIHDGLDSFTLLDLLKDRGVELITGGLKILTSFNYLSKEDRVSLICERLHAYCVIKWIQHNESISLEGVTPDLAHKLTRILEHEAMSLRVQPGVFNTLAVIILYQVDDRLSPIHAVHNDSEEYIRLLQKVVSSNCMRDDEFSQLCEIVPDVLSAASSLRQLTGVLEHCDVDALF